MTDEPTAADLFDDYERDAFMRPVTLGGALADPEPNPRFVVDSIEKAEWAARRWLEAKGEVSRLVATAERLKARVDRWLERAARPSARSVEFFEGLLVAYHRAKWEEAIAAGVPERKRPKSIALPSATLASRAPSSKGRLVVDDEDALVEWLRERDHEVKTIKAVVRKDELRALAVTTEKDGAHVLVLDGEVVPHAHVEIDDERSWSVRTGDAGEEDGE